MKERMKERPEARPFCSIALAGVVTDNNLCETEDYAMSICIRVKRRAPEAIPVLLITSGRPRPSLLCRQKLHNSIIKQDRSTTVDKVDLDIVESQNKALARIAV